ncbi:MAG: hypothetical protein RL654_2526 [Pseudomonadota bacterium]
MFLPADPDLSSDALSVFALLDEADAPAGAPRSRLLSGWLGEWRCDDPATLEAVWAGAQAQIAAGAHALLLADYEWGVRLVGAGTPGGWSEQAPGALRLLMFSRLQRLDAEGVAAWLAQAEGRAEPAPAAVLAPQPDDDDATYAAAIARIHALIRAGETYQVNHTLRLRGQALGTPLALYRRLRALQPVPFGALVALPGDRWVLSCSPELFVRHEAGRLQARPMKGTAARRPDDAQADAAAAAWLAADLKNRAENLMIVDLLRNDLGRIARTGSVKVPALFQVEPYRTVFQMTSTIEAEPAPDADLPAVLRALFPCGSITGAPKHRTMQLIESLESSPRGLYTGAIGWVEAPAPGSDRRLGDFALSVAIRTLALGAPAEGGLRPVTLGVGGGIVLDSVAEDEAAEWRLKSRFATRPDPGFTLFETIRVEAGQPLRLPAHLARLGASAAALGFAFDGEALRAAVLAQAQTLPGGLVHRLRLDLARDGGWQIRHGVLALLPDGPLGLLPPGPALPADEAALLAHKTSLRATYDAAIREAETLGAFDRVFVNARGELTEGARSTLLLRLDGRWWTPPVAAGALPGVMRAALMADPAWALQERVLFPVDLERAEALALCNALRGVCLARLQAGHSRSDCARPEQAG